MTRRIPIGRRLNLDAVLRDGTQDYRWRPREDCWYSGVLDGHLVHVRQIDGALEYRADANLDTLIVRYFRLDDDIEAILAEISRDGRIAGLVAKYPHLRIIRQPDPWECTVAYICSANNNVRRIAESIEKIAERLGRPIELGDDRRHTFPTPEVVLDAGEEALAGLKLGLNRHRKIVAAARRICEGTLDLGSLSQPEVCYAEAKRRLMVCDGIGGKVADCIALFSLYKLEAFPVDIWVRRAMAGYFPGDEPPPDDELIIWAQDHFGQYAGYANQFLFRGARDASDTPRGEQ